MLLYPVHVTAFEAQDFTSFTPLTGNTSHHACGLGKIAVFETGTTKLDKAIGRTILGWF